MLILCFLIVSIIIFCSCKKQLISDSEISLSNTKITDVPIFLSQQHFNESIESLKSTGLISKRIDNIVRLEKNLKSVEGEITDTLADTLIYSELLKELLNERYEIVIGDVFFKISELGTFFTPRENYVWLRELNINDTTLVNTESINYALGYSFPNGMYKLKDYNNLFFYDTFRKKDPSAEIPTVNLQALKSATLPLESDWVDVNDGRTLAGKAWDGIWGFSKSVENHFDSRNVVDVKFYAQRFPFYSEMGIKTKTQYKGWTGLWRKADCDEIINGWEILNLEEKWPRSLFGPFATTNGLPDFNFQTQAAKNLGYSQSVFLKKTWKTFDILGLELDFTQKEKIGALWNASKIAGKSTVSFLNNKFQNPTNSLEAIRLIPSLYVLENNGFVRNYDISKTKISLAPYSEGRTLTDMHTTIIANSSGGTISINITGYNEIGWPDPLKDFTNLTAKYTFLQNSILYGAARRGGIWRGVRITFD